MDTSDPDIAFNEEGVCSHCTYFDEEVIPNWFPGNEEGQRRLSAMVKEIKDWGKNKEYDCLIGLSGGVDSSYLAYQVKEVLGLRPLAVHVDAGWNSELAVQNIENIVKKLDIDLYTYVVDWPEMKDLQYAYLKSGVANQDVPQDHVFTATLYRTAKKHGIKYFLGGSNKATEAILPSSWGYNALDLTNLLDIHKKFGKRKLKTYPTISFFEYYIYFPYIFGLKKFRPLDWMDYRRDAAVALIEEKLNWRNYGEKHHESRFTKFFQAHYLPHKFGYDKRRAHLSSLILSGQISRDQALKEMEVPLYDPVALQEDKEFVAKKLGFSMNEFESLLNEPGKDNHEYKTQDKFFKFKDKIKKMLAG
ncbi:N-acetyl sugar amidotransferase [Emcibacter nanhaiensis]